MRKKGEIDALKLIGTFVLVLIVVGLLAWYVGDRTKRGAATADSIACQGSNGQCIAADKCTGIKTDIKCPKAGEVEQICCVDFNKDIA